LEILYNKNRTNIKYYTIIFSQVKKISVTVHTMANHSVD